MPIRLVESGPAGGAAAAAHHARSTGARRVLAFDMGGTTAKICLIDDGEPQITREFEVARVWRFKRGSGLPLLVPVVEMIEIGAGGGSIAHVDRMRLPKVGPESAGSEPGPACYGRGGERPTVTDANLVLGYLDEAYFLGGAMPLDRAAAEAAIRRHVAEPLGLSLTEAAWGIHAIVTENMANAALMHAVERGKEWGPTTSTPSAARRRCTWPPSPSASACRTVVVPPGAGVRSCFGFLASPLAFEVARSHGMRLEAPDLDALAVLLDALEAKSGARPSRWPACRPLKGQFGQTNYSAAKAGMHGFTKALAQEVVKKGVTVNTISPGYVDTDMVRAIKTEVLDSIVSSIPMGRLARPEEIAGLVSYLSSDDAGYITGANISINGGLHME